MVEVEAAPALDRQVDVDQVVAAGQQADEPGNEEDEALQKCGLSSPDYQQSNPATMVSKFVEVPQSTVPRLQWVPTVRHQKQSASHTVRVLSLKTFVGMTINTTEAGVLVRKLSQLTPLSSAKRANPRYFITLCEISCELPGCVHRPIVDSESTIAG